MSLNPEHHLCIDATYIDGPARTKIINAAIKAGGSILNEDIALLIDSAPPEPKMEQRYGQETELGS